VRFVIGSTLLACSNDPPAAPALESASKRIASIEADIGGRLGVCALDTSSGGRIVHRAAERFANVLDVQVDARRGRSWRAPIAASSSSTTPSPRCANR